VILTDGIDCGYFGYMASPEMPSDGDNLNGGLSPLSEKGLRVWLEKSPGFRLSKVETPVRLVAISDGALLELWEWFAGLRLQGKAVELVEIPHGTHILAKPRDRQIAMQGMVDWFRFWLKGEEDLNPMKREQYVRWRRMRTINNRPRTTIR